MELTADVPGVPAGAVCSPPLLLHFIPEIGVELFDFEGLLGLHAEIVGADVGGELLTVDEDEGDASIEVGGVVLGIAGAATYYPLRNCSIYSNIRIQYIKLTIPHLPLRKPQPLRVPSP